VDNNGVFEDHYETLQLNPNADQETIERIFRLLAKRYHPDNPDSGDTEKFSRLLKAYAVLSNAGDRAQYDTRYFSNRTVQWKVFDRNTNDQEGDRRIFQALLSMLYVARRQSLSKPGLGTIQLEQLMGCSAHYLEFHLWYLKEKGWIERLDNGQFAITASGVEKVSEGDMALRTDRLLSDRVRSTSPESDGGMKPTLGHQPQTGNGTDGDPV
jgi:curved DNA-binding protein